MKLQDGIHEGISNFDYHSDREYLSSSVVKLLYEDPKAFHAKYILGEKEKTPARLQEAFDFGSYLHTLILEPELLSDEYRIYTGAREDEGWKDFVKANKKFTVVTESQVKAANALYQKYKAESVLLGNQGEAEEVPLSSFFEKGYAEQTFCGELEGVKIKVRPDYRREFSDFGSIQDVKTTSEKSLTRYRVEKICTKYGYHISAAMYVDLVEKLTGKRQDFYFLFLSKSSKQVAMFKASEAMLKRGRDQYKLALKRYKEAKETGVWYEHVIEELR